MAKTSFFTFRERWQRYYNPQSTSHTVSTLNVIPYAERSLIPFNPALLYYHDPSTKCPSQWTSYPLAQSHSHTPNILRAVVRPVELEPRLTARREESAVRAVGADRPEFRGDFTCDLANSRWAHPRRQMGPPAAPNDLASEEAPGEASVLRAVLETA